MLRTGNRIIRMSTNSITNAKGKAPRKTSFNAMRSSFSVVLMTKQEIPNGGVNKPISAPCLGAAVPEEGFGYRVFRDCAHD